MLFQTKKGEDKKEKPPVGSIFGSIGCKKKEQKQERGAKMTLIDQLTHYSSKQKGRKQERKATSCNGLIPHKAKKETGKGIQEEVNCIAALPNKKGEDRKEWLPLWINQLLLKKKGGQDAV